MGWQRSEEHREGAGGAAGWGQGHSSVSCTDLGANGGGGEKERRREGGGGKEEEESERRRRKRKRKMRRGEGE